MIKSYRGLIADGGQDTVPLHTNDGKIGYKIVKFSLMCKQPGLGNQESVVKIYKVPPGTIPTSAATIDFNDNTLIAAAIFTASTNQKTDPEDLSVIFDNEIFNQDIYVTHTDNEGALDINYYFELEQIDLTEDQALVAIVKNLRNEQ